MRWLAGRRLAALALPALLLAPHAARAQQTEKLLLSGTGKDDTVSWEFRIDGGRRAGSWSTIPVPSNWEMHGFGSYRYGDDWSEDPVPDGVGHYRHRFAVPAEWAGRSIDLVFGGAMTDTEVRIDGQPAGPVHRGGFYEFRYDVTSLLTPGQESLLEVDVQRISSDASINRAERQTDFWLFGGIYRPVWLEASPPQHVERLAVDARHTGELKVHVFLEGLVDADRVVARVRELEGAAVADPFSAGVKPGSDGVVLAAAIPGVRPWSAEWPHRYALEVRLLAGERVLHERRQVFGFRSVEVRPGDGFYVNGARVRLRGVNRHSFWPESGRTTSEALSFADAGLIKDMNMNAVRMSHYPPDAHFLEAADALGLYVIDELTGWQAAYDTAPGEPLVRELVLRDVNHPSVILWANGNEGGWNEELDDDFGRWDPQERTVIHPWQSFGGLNTSHYEAWDCCTGWFFGGDELILPTEFLHGLYDGGHGAGLEDWWERIRHHPLGVGGFLWAFADEGIVRDDQGGRIDVTGNRAPDGIVGPYREKEGSFFAIKEVWSPVRIAEGSLARLPPSFGGVLRVENLYDFTSLSQVGFRWRLVDFPGLGTADVGHAVAATGDVESPAVPPRGVGELSLELPRDWRDHDALYLTATDSHGREIYTWSWMIPGAAEVAERVVPTAPPGGRVAAVAAEGLITMRAGATAVAIDTATGRLRAVSRDGAVLPLQDGPRLIGGEARLASIEHFAEGDDHVVEAAYEGNLQHVRWRLSPSGWLRLDYEYRFPRGSEHDILGVSFDHAEDGVTGLRWLGRGPYRVWKNRLQGAEFDVWRKAASGAVTGNDWSYPEFEGFRADVYWATLESAAAPLTLVFGSDDLFLRLFTPREGVEPRTTHVEFPEGDLSILHGIAPIGTKFHPASALGPSGQPNSVRRRARYAGTVYFGFGGEAPEVQR